MQWENSLQEDATWEDLQVMAASYPDFNIEDKVILKGEGNVMKHVARDKLEGEEGMHNKLTENGTWEEKETC